ncbi:MAG: hypothetical protein HWN66_13925 [Candidatus Helarchaeota archaeon]|nr:hypothetical protein [Candidatus Helarchaeota archaeon]
MALDRDALKQRLLEIARQESIKFGADVKKEMKKTIKLEKNKAEKWVKIIYVGENIQRTPIDKESFEILLGQFSKDRKPVAYEIINEKDFVKFQFKDEEIVDKVYNHYDSFFFGNLQQQTVNAFFTKYINELLDEGCATGTCGCHSSDTCDIPIPSEKKDPDSE